MSARRPVEVVFPRADLRALREACLRLADRAWIRLDLRGGKVVAALTPRGKAAGLAADLRAACEEAKARRRARAAARAFDAAAMSRALDLAAHVDAVRREPTPELSPARRAEIAALLAEDAAAPRDPLGLRVPWSELKRGDA